MVPSRRKSARNNRARTGQQEGCSGSGKAAGTARPAPAAGRQLRSRFHTRGIPSPRCVHCYISAGPTERLDEHRQPQLGLYCTSHISPDGPLCPRCLDGGRASCSPRHSHSPVADRASAATTTISVRAAGSATRTGIAWSSGEPVTSSDPNGTIRAVLRPLFPGTINLILAR